MILLALVELGLLLLCFLEARGPNAAAAHDGDEAVFVGDGAGCFAEAVAQGFEGVELREVGVERGLEEGGRGVDEGGVGFVAWFKMVGLALFTFFVVIYAQA